MAVLAITRTDWSVAELRTAAKRAAHTNQGLRILAIAMVQDGYRRREAAQTCGMDRQTLRDWVRRYNEAGIDGLADRSRSGRPASLTQVEQAEGAAWVEQGADLRAVIANGAPGSHKPWVSNYPNPSTKTVEDQPAFPFRRVRPPFNQAVERHEPSFSVSSVLPYSGARQRTTERTTRPGRWKPASRSAH